MDKSSNGGPESQAPVDLLAAIAVDAIATCHGGRAVTRAVVAGPGKLILAGCPIRTTAPGRILVLAVGKASAPMYEAFLERLAAAEARRQIAGLVIGPRGAPAPGGVARTSAGGVARARAGRGSGARMRVATTVIAAEHPAPAKGSFRAGRAAQRFMGGARPGDDVVVLVSGGGSALMAAPLAPFITAAQKTTLHQVLVVSGAPIGAINTVRRHVSAIKGGRLAIAARRARSLTTLTLCDVDPDRHDDVASGPSVPDRTTIDDMVAIVDQYGLAPALPEKVLEGLRTGRLPETPKPKNPAFRRAHAQTVLANVDLRHAAVRSGLTRGLSAEAMPNEITTPVEKAVELVARAIEGAPTGLRLLVLGGEARTAPSAPGAGGRAQEFALRLALRMRNLSMRGWAFLAAGSDGQDGNSPAAGAFVDATTLARAAALRLDPEKTLARAETYRFFHRLGDTFITGPTATNVRDVYLLLTGLPRPETEPGARGGRT